MMAPPVAPARLAGSTMYDGVGVGQMAASPIGWSLDRSVPRFGLLAWSATNASLVVPAPPPKLSSAATPSWQLRHRMELVSTLPSVFTPLMYILYVLFTSTARFHSGPVTSPPSVATGVVLWGAWHGRQICPCDQVVTPKSCFDPTMPACAVLL